MLGLERRAARKQLLHVTEMQHTPSVISRKFCPGQRRPFLLGARTQKTVAFRAKPHRRVPFSTVQSKIGTIARDLNPVAQRACGCAGCYSLAWRNLLPI